MKRSRPLQRKAWPKRSSKPLPRVNRKRRKRLYERNFGERGAAVRLMPCIAAASGNCEGPIQACHARARGMGGCKGDRRCLFAACAKHHREAGEYGTSQRAKFEADNDVSVMAHSEATALVLDARGYP